jgi:hypothetical protein
MRSVVGISGLQAGEDVKALPRSVGLCLDKAVAHSAWSNRDIRPPEKVVVLRGIADSRRCVALCLTFGGLFVIMTTLPILGELSIGLWR